MVCKNLNLSVTEDDIADMIRVLFLSELLFDKYVFKDFQSVSN